MKRFSRVLVAVLAAALPAEGRSRAGMPANGLRAAMPSPPAKMRQGTSEGRSPQSGRAGEDLPPPPREGGRGGGTGVGGPRAQDVPIIVTALDLNGDGVIDADEIAKAPESLRKLDKSGDRELTPDELHSARRDRQGEPAGGPARGGGGYSIEQAVSGRAQLHTIAFDALAFLTGDLGSCTFLPPGKVADFCGFQYMRDVDKSELGHNTSFVPRAANNVLYILTDEQKAELVALAKEQEKLLTDFAYARFPLIKAFCRQLMGDIPAGHTGLNREAVMNYAARFFEIDGLLSFQRAKVLGSMIRSLTEGQKAYLGKMVFDDSATWPELEDQVDKRRLSHAAHVAVMTYASEMFSWYAGSLEADLYFCPERHATYFGSFYMKDIPAMGNANFSISTSLTGDSGEAFLAVLSESQRQLIEGLVDLQRKDLQEIVGIRRAIALELRRFMEQESVDSDKILSLSRRYGELDGEISYLYAMNFAEVGKTLTDEQRKALLKLRNLDSKFACKGAYLYSQPIDMPEIRNTDFLFGRSAPHTPAEPADASSTLGSCFVFRSPAVTGGGWLPKEYTGDGVGATLPLEWSSPPAGTKSYAIIMHHVDPEGKAKWYWTLYNIPANVQSLSEDAQGIGTLGTNSVNGKAEYAPPHSKGPGAKTYILTIYALSAPLEITVPPSEVTRDVLLASMKEKVLTSAQLEVVYSREAAEAGRGGGGSGGEASGAAAPAGPPRDARRDERSSRDPVEPHADGRTVPRPNRGRGNRGDLIIEALDLNRDGTIDADEIAKAPESLKKLDRDGDRELTQEEYRRPPQEDPDAPGEGQGQPPSRDGE